MNNKKIIPILMAIISIFSLTSCNTKIVEGPFTFEKNKKKNEATLIKYHNDDLVIEIPETVKGIPITKIASKAFNRNNSFDKLVISNNLKIIEKGAFIGCENLNKLDIQNIGNLEIKCNMHINEIYVSNCDDWLEIVTPKNVKLRKSSSDLIIDNKSVTNIDIRTKITKIRKEAFYGSNSLETVMIPNNIEIIEDHAFALSKRLRSVNFSSGSRLEYIEDDAFNLCESLNSIVIPSGVKEIGNYAFGNCYSLTSVFIPKSVEFIDYFAFANCNNLVIYCEHESEPSNWDYLWNGDDCPVVWGSSGINN